MFESVPWWMMVLGFLAVLGPLVTLHEFGHYLVGRAFGVQADAFSIGFGKELAGFTDKRGCRWKISALPLGGYVQFRGDMNPASQGDDAALAEMDEETAKGAFQNAKLWQRALIVAAGPAMNFLIAIVIFVGFFMFYGKPVATNLEEQMTVASFAEESAAREAGFRIGDRILAIDGKPVDDFRDIQSTVQFYPSRSFEFTVERGGRELVLPVTSRPETITDRFGNEMTIGLVGISPAAVEYEFQGQSLPAATRMAFVETGRTLDMMVKGIGQIVSGQRSVKELGGPIKIAKFSGEQMSLGPLAYVTFAALISINLAFINLLPIPGLDGGHLAFYAAEAVRRKPLGQRSQQWAFRTGMALVLALMLFVTVNDIISLPIFGS